MHFTVDFVVCKYNIHEMSPFTIYLVIFTVHAAAADSVTNGSDLGEDSPPNYVDNLTISTDMQPSW